MVNKLLENQPKSKIHFALPTCSAFLNPTKTPCFQVYYAYHNIFWPKQKYRILLPKTSKNSFFGKIMPNSHSWPYQVLTTCTIQLMSSIMHNKNIFCCINLKHTKKNNTKMK